MFNTEGELRGLQCPELEDHDCKNDKHTVGPESVQDQLFQLDPFKFMGPYGIHLRILKVLAGVIAGPLSMIFEHSLNRTLERSQLTESWLMLSQFSRRPRRMILETTGLVVSLQGLVKSWRWLFFGSYWKTLEGQVDIDQSQQGFMKGKSCLSNLISWQDNTPSWSRGARTCNPFGFR